MTKKDSKSKQSGDLRKRSSVTDITEITRAEAEMARLASFPALNPDPVAEVDFMGQIHYLNPAAERLFPDLRQRGAEHPWLIDWESCVRTLREGGKKVRVREVNVGGRWCQQTMYYVEETQCIRIYGTDITKRKKEEEELNRLNRTLRAMSNSNHAMLRSTNETEYLNEVCRIVVEDCGHAMVWICYAEDDEDKTVRPVAYAGFEEGYIERLNITWADTERGRGPTGTAIRTGKPSGCANILTDPLFAPWRKDAIERGYASSMVLPLMAGGRAFGAINIYSRKPEAFSEDEVKLLTELADDLAHGITMMRFRITHAKSQKALRESEERYRELVENANSIIIRMDQSGNITFFNEYAQKFFGYSLDEILGKDVRILLPRIESTSGRSLVEIADAILKNPDDFAENINENIRKNGERVWISWTNKGIRDSNGSIVGTLAIGQDITERKRAEDALQKSEERFRQLADSTFEGILIHDKGVILDVNQALTRLTGYDYEEAIGKDVFAFIAPESKEAVLHRMQYPTAAPLEMSLIKKDRTTCLVEVAARSINYGGKMARVVAMRDITERKKAEDAIKEHAAQLEEANKELESFSYSVSHDLRAPLRAIDGYARMILKKQGDKFDEDTLRKFNDIRLNARTMGKLIDDLLTFSRLSRKNMSTSQLNMVDLIREEWKVLNDINPDRKMNLIVNSTPLGYGDAALVKQVYHNLLSNAVKFTKLRDYAHIEVGGYNDGNEDVFYVKDNGVGFDMKYYDKLFGVFQRLHNNPNFEGTGVGLATVQRIVHRQGGRVWAEGKLNEGATFYFTLPHKEID